MPFDGVITAPKVQPARFGLFSAADVVEHGADDEHWIGGFDYESEACNFLGTLRDICDPNAIDYVFNAGEEPRSRKAMPFSINAIDKCSTFGFSAIDRRERVMRQLETVTQKSVERELFGGAFTTLLGHDNRFLASPAATVVTTGAVSAQQALAMLEGAVGECGPGYPATIHLPRAVASVLSGQYRQVPADPGQLETMIGSRIAAGSGYTGVGPAGQAPTPTVQWIYATGPVTVHLGPGQLVNARVAEATDIHINDLTYQAERPAAVTWDGCCHFAAEVNITL